MNVNHVRSFVVENPSEGYRRHDIALAVQIAKVVDAFSYRETPHRHRTMVILLVSNPWSRDGRVHSIELLLPREGLDVHLGPTDRIGMKRERHVKHFHH